MPTLAYDPAQFSLDDTLACGQAFRWERLAAGVWRGVVGTNIITLQQDGDRLTYESSNGAEADVLRALFLLDVDLAAIRGTLVASDPALRDPIGRAPGLRLMRQDPDECLLSFICSTANNVPRIVAGIRRMSALLGEPLGAVDGQTYHAFPTVATLAGADPARLQAATGLGYRAGRVVDVAQQLAARGPSWLLSLREAPYPPTHAALVELRGVGPKVADCVCLFSLDHTEAVPVDTHIWQAAQQLWGRGAAGIPLAMGEKAAVKGLTGAGYRRVGELFRTRYGRLSGYAQNWLFYDHFRGYWGGTSPLLKG
ncbi:MAG TPA: DNA glycosylase [Chloroflexia bacterium]|nr:DNA glycosylase [Chloroflexia bacterium]